MRRNFFALLPLLLLMLVSAMPANSACSNSKLAASTPNGDLTDNGDFTVTHAKTGLMWKQCAEGQSGAGCATDSALVTTWLYALKAANTANTAVFAGYSDWRLPNVKELESIVESCNHGPSINRTKFPATTTITGFWSASSVVRSPHAQAWYVDFYDGNTSTGNKSVEPLAVRLVRGGLSFDSFDGSFTINTATAPMTGLWWNPNESGWGMSIEQQGPIMFIGWYTYDRSGNSTRYYMSNCAVSGNSCTGDISYISGGAAPTVPWTGRGPSITVGTGTLTFSDTNTGVFNFVLNGVPGSKNIVRMVFGTPITPPAADYTALWWNPNESGWGVFLTHQSSTIFAVLFSYDALGNPLRYVASNCTVSGNGCTGTLSKTSGGSAPTEQWVGPITQTPVGTIAFTFADASNATMNFTIDGQHGAKTISKLIFYTPPPAGSPYAGNWSGSYTGSDQGTCTMTISTSGAVAGSCVGKQAGTFAIIGSADANGILSFHLSSGGSSSATFSGPFVSTTRANGTWYIPTNGYSGTWVMTHD